jgi:hypothetical protein
MRFLALTILALCGAQTAQADMENFPPVFLKCP